MKVFVHRVASNNDGTFGVLSVDGQPVCVTLEDKWLDNEKRVSCIPEGVYSCAKYSGTKFKNVWLVKAVPGREAILLHWGNTHVDTSGCILVGRTFAKFGNVWGVGRSKDAFEMLRDTFPDTFTLVIKDCFEKKPKVFTNPKRSFWARLFKGD